MNKEYKLPMAAFEFVFFIKKKSQNSVLFGVRLKVTLLPISMMVTDDEVKNEQRIQASHGCI